MRLCLAALLVLTALPATAAERAPQQPPTTRVVFGEGDVIDGKLDGPDGLGIDATPRAEHPSLLRSRDSFRDELLASAAEL